jgi:hypothetical protein
MVAYYQDLHYPIARSENVPTLPMIHQLILWDLIGGLVLAYGLWLGSNFARRTSSRKSNAPQEHSQPEQHVQDGSALLATWGKRLFCIGLAGSVIVVAVTHSIALFDSNVDTVRFTQGVGIGFATLAQYELVVAGIIGLFLALNRGQYTKLGTTLACLSIIVLIATRAERTPTLLTIFGAVILARLTGRNFRIVPVFLTVIVLLGGVLYLGVFRLQSQESGQVSSKKAQVRALLDISPEVREQAFVFTLWPSRTPYLGVTGILPVFLAPVPGKLLSLAGVDKQELTENSAVAYTAVMNKLGIYATTVPVRVGLAGELWMDAGPLGLIVGMFLYGIIGAWVTVWRPRTPLRLVARALVSAFLILTLIAPLAIWTPIAFVTLLPLLLARDGAPIPVANKMTATHHLQSAAI